MAETLPAAGPEVPCLHSVGKLSLSATLYCLDRLALVNLFSMFKTFFLPRSYFFFSWQAA